MIKLLLADARPEVRRGLRMWLGLQPDVTVVGETGSNDELLAMVREQQPDVVVLDVALLDGDPLAAAAAVRAASTSSREGSKRSTSLATTLVLVASLWSTRPRTSTTWSTPSSPP
jgi:DNA-binding NarL/FixJ family response regulator